MLVRMLPQEWSTPRLSLRPPVRDDAVAIFSGWTTDANATRYLTWRPHRRPEDTRQFVDRCIEAWRGQALRVWVITRYNEPGPIGMIEVRVDGYRAELGYVLAPPAWGHGYMTEVVQTVTQMALHEIPVARVAAVCDVDNGASARVLEKSGLLREARLRRYIVHPNISDEPRDVYLYARTRPLRASMLAQDVLDVLAALADRNTPIWIGGGWGIDALLGEQTREHADLDVACRAEHEATILETLAMLGYRVVLDYRPARVAVADDDGREIDLHPVRFDAHGIGVLPGLRGEHFDYPPDGFATGLIGGQSVACLSVAQQLRFHTGYQLRDHERQDLANLRTAFGST
jgi:RimJ/RimL family protein N-acetyltransferase